MHEDRVKQPARWNLLAAAAPFGAFLLGLAIADAYGGHPVTFAVVGLRTCGVVSALGLISGIVALIRRERWVSLTIVGLLLNAAGVALGAYAFFEMFVWGPPQWSN